MITSMTAFSRKMHEDKWGSLVWELRSVNHRYLEISTRMPEALRHLEKDVRTLIQEHLKRGKIEANLKYKPGEEVPFDFVVNKTLIKKLAQAGNDVAEFFPEAQTNLMDIINWQGVLQIKEVQTEEIDKVILSLLTSTLDDMVSMRQREGEGLVQFMQQRLQQMQTDIKKVKEHLPKVLTAQRQRIVDRFEELKLEVDGDRLEQEMVWLMQKTDVAEELHRLESHIDEVQRVLKKGGVVGRRLDFLMQELNREANTLASKSIDATLTQVSVDLKVCIEQMREQVQNIE